MYFFFVSMSTSFELIDELSLLFELSILSFISLAYSGSMNFPFTESYLFFAFEMAFANDAVSSLSRSVFAKSKTVDTSLSSDSFIEVLYFFPSAFCSNELYITAVLIFSAFFALNSFSFISSIFFVLLVFVSVGTSSTLVLSSTSKYESISFLVSSDISMFLLSVIHCAFAFDRSLSRRTSLLLLPVLLPLILSKSNENSFESLSTESLLLPNSISIFVLVFDASIPII